VSLIESVVRSYRKPPTAARHHRNSRQPWKNSWRNPNGERDFLDTWESLNELSKSQDWSTSQLWAKAVNSGQIVYFTHN